ncbi:phage tail assembly protein [Paenibacillus alvei]|uniref:Phage tail assembly protein n=1 Tax=Paenibacillus alvei TaxID=44250 RepID=A0ABT4H6W8_PAEAL|nr:phage tail assembly protein [Paenibacillus alvei]MCY9764732.1 phage tail assembly protein [Paenibacillus alvei]MCY9770322.1 phage tail assembly protein [Paenibacillus alvei]
MEQYTLIKPIVFQGEEVKEIQLDLDSLTGEDIIYADRQFLLSNEMNQGITVKETTKEFLMFVGARAAKQPGELFYRLSAKDFSRVTLRVQNFLLVEESV